MTLALVLHRQSYRTLDDVALEAAASSVAAQLAEIETRRRALLWSQERLCAGASVNRRTYERALSGAYIPLPKTIRSLFRELERGEAARAPVAAEIAADRRMLFEAMCRTAALAFELDAAAVVAVRPADNRPRDPRWLALVRAKHVALYALVMTDRVSMAAAAALAGVSKQAISQALKGVEDRRHDEPEFDRRVSLVELR